MNRNTYNKSGTSGRDRGQAMIMATVFFLVISLVIIYGLAGPLVREKRAIANTLTSRESYFLAEAAVEDVIARLKVGKTVGGSETLTLGSSSATVTTTDTDDGKEIIATANTRELVRVVKTEIGLGEGVSFHYGMQAGEGGIILENTSSVVGNAYANGPVIGSGSNLIKGDVVSGGPTGWVEKVHATSSVYAHTIKNTTVDKNAYYQTITSSTVSGTSYPNSVDQATTSLPITDAMIEEWKAEAEAGGVINSPCPYVINSNATLGPVKINCDVEVSGNGITVTVLGNIWITGNFTVRLSPTIRADASLANRGAAIIADNLSNRLTSSKMSFENSTIFLGTGQPKSFMFMISQNNSAENGGTEAAINVQNTVSGDLLVYAGHGELQLQNSVQLREATAYRIRLKNSAQVQYKTGLANLLFSEGPSGGYEILNWQEVE